jgi:hypothetical protein
MKASRQEWFKLRDNILEDVFVCVEQERANDCTIGSTILAERYIKREIGLEVHYVSYGKGRPCYFVAIFEASHATASFERMQEKSTSLYPNRSARHSSSHQSRRAMLVRIPHSVKSVKKAIPVASIVRLFVRNPILDFDWKTLNLGRISFQKLGFRFVELEAKVIGGISRLSQPINKTVDCSAKVMNRISRAKSKGPQGLFVDLHFKDNMTEIPFSLYLLNYCIWPRTLRKKCVGIKYELIDAMPCPIEPSLGKLHIFRTRFTHETSQTDSNNIERCGNPHPEAGRLLQESEESRHAFNVQPQEEVAAQIAPSHLRGGCTATHTRSDNPEGAS